MFDRGRKQRAHALAARDTNQSVRLGTGADDAFDTRRHKDTTRADLRDHAASAHRGRRIARRADNGRIDLVHARDKARIGVERGIGRVEAVDIGKGDAHVCRDQTAHKRRQGIVVPKLNLGHAHGVVLVYDGHHTELHQAQ